MMKKYVLTNEDGDTGTGVKMSAGKFVLDAAKHMALLSKLTSCVEHPGLAALLSPVIPDRIKMFQVHSWNVAVGDPNQAQNYTVIKEMPTVPHVTNEMRISFALLILKDVVLNRDFKQWAEGWIAGKERGANSAAAMRKSIEGEHEVNEGLAELAAWGAAGADDIKTVNKLDEQDQRAIQAIHAAELLADGPGQSEATAREIAAALFDIGRHVGKPRMLELAGRVMGPEAMVVPEADSQAGAG